MAETALLKLSSALSAARQTTHNAEPPCLECVLKPELQAVILFPSLGTPFVAHTSEKSIKVYLLVEDECVDLFEIKTRGGGKQAPLAWCVINKHLRLLPFKGIKKTSANLQGERLYSSLGAAKAGIKVTYHGVYGGSTRSTEGTWGNALQNSAGQIVATMRPSAVDFFVKAQAAYGAIEPAHQMDPKVAKVDNAPLRHLFEIDLSLAGLAVSPSPDTAYTLAWMVTCVYNAKPRDGSKPPLKEEVTHWEHQDKLIYDFLAMMRKNKQHFSEPFTFNVEAAQQGIFPEQLKGEAKRLKSYHPVMFKSKPALHIGHLSDVHVNSRHFALAKSEAETIPGEKSTAIGPKITNSFIALRELFESMRSNGADALFITGDLLDFNQNFNPNKLSDGPPREQWAQYDLSQHFKNGVALPQAPYVRGLDDMLVYSLIKHSYLHNCPVFVVTGNHEAYDVPYGIAPRLNDRGIAQTYQETAELRRRMKDREDRASALEDEAKQLDKQGDSTKATDLRQRADAIRAERLPGESVAPARLTKTEASWVPDPAERARQLDAFADSARYAGRKAEQFFGGSGDGDSSLQEFLKFVKQKTEVERTNAYEYSAMRANEGVPADHNLTIYEACMAYGPSYGQIVKAWNFVPSNFDWFFMMFTPLADFRVNYSKTQCLIGLDWGETEIMVNADMSWGEISATTDSGAEEAADASSGKVDYYKNKLLPTIGKKLMGNLQALPRADKSISRRQQLLVEGALKQEQAKNVLFTHFTLLNYDMPVPYSGGSKAFALNDETFNEYTKGSFSVRRRWLLGDVVNRGLHYSLSGHSHRAGVYRLNNRDLDAARGLAYETAITADDSLADTHKRMFPNQDATRLIVSSCGGPIGVQNVNGELFGWNLRPPSGTLLKTDSVGLDECRRIVAKAKQSTPRFCVTLDFMFVVARLNCLTWAPRWSYSDKRTSSSPNGPFKRDTSKDGHFYLSINHIPEYVPFIQQIDFLVWSSKTKKFTSHPTKLEPIHGGSPLDPVMQNNFVDWEAFSRAVSDSKGAPVLVKIQFNKNLTARSMYQHFNFDDAWVFPVNVNGEQIERPSGQYGEVPRFSWFSTNMKDDFGFSGLPQQ